MQFKKQKPPQIRHKTASILSRAKTR